MQLPLPKILIAEDDTNFGMMLKIFLEMNHCEVTLCENGEIAAKTFKNQNFDLCILDIMMPLLDGFALAESIRKTYKNTPFVFLSAKALKEDQMKGYKLGASDYLIKPFDPEILLVKINLLLQKSKKNLPQVFNIGNYEFDAEKRMITLSQKQQKISPKENELLRMLCEKNGELLTYEEALIKIWGNDDYFTKQSMNVFITKLRKILSQDTDYQIEIENLHSKGLMLKYEKKTNSIL
jgi:two-component system, OmpR family, response regulator